MRILQIRLKNLNSLAGEWLIDLTHPSYESNGIFAITGPTGAGKSTILDALCLALYGSTPRLGKISKNSNEIMARHTGECFAEVVFETQKGRFRAYWGQHRSRKKADGELQNPKQEIVCHDTGKPIETKIKNVGDYIENVTGMTFERFTRSILLAQGGFSAFLQAEPDKRAPILEQITGTGIYSEISRRVHKKAAEENKTKEKLEAEVNSIKCLTEEEEKELQIKLNEKLQQEEPLKKQLEEYQRKADWLIKHDELKNTLESLQIQLKEIEEQKRNFQPKMEKLELAKRASLLVEEHTHITAVRKQFHDASKELTQLNEQLPRLEAAFAEAESQYSIALENHQNAKNALKNELELIPQITPLDERIKNLTADAENTAQTISEKQNQKLRTEEKIELCQQGNLKLKEQSARASEYLETHQQDSILIEEFSALKHQLEEYQRLTEGQRKLEQDEIKLRNELYSVTQEIADLELANKEAHHKLQNHKQHVLNLQNQRQSIFKELSINNINESTTLSKLEQIDKLNKECSSLKNSIHQLTTNKNGYELQLQSYSEKIQSTSRQVEEVEKIIRSLETKLLSLSRIWSLEEERSLLVEGNPCQLCGSTSHPYSIDHPPAPEKTQTELNKYKDACNTLKNNLSDLNIKYAQMDKDLQQAKKEEKSHLSSLADKEKEISALLKETGAQPDAIAALINAAREKIQSANLSQRKAGELNGQINELEPLTHSLEAQYQELQQKMSSVKETAAKINQDIQHALLSHKNNSHTLLHIAQRCQDIYSPLSEQDFFKHPAKTIDYLKIQREQWLTNKNAKDKLDHETSIKTIEISNLQGHIHQLEQDVSTAKQQLEHIQSNLASQQAKRQNLYGSKNPYEEQKLLQASLEHAENSLDLFREKMNFSKESLDKCRTSLENTKRSLSILTSQLQDLELNFLQNLSKAQFTDEIHFIGSKLSKEELLSLEKESNDLDQKLAIIASKYHDTSQEYALLSSQRLTSESLVSIQNSILELQKNLSSSSEEIGRLKEKIQSNLSQKDLFLSRQATLERQESLTNKWNLLDKLIGSSDGKLYRNFAQNLTFEMMIIYANQQLEKMSNRYLLIPDNKIPLEINIIDQYQAGERRSIKNLSGGESFLVSLSLALGLSRMASSNVRVDSLFLDEGFGTLDDDALESALDTLSNLNQEGKLIGIISHVPALKERISAQIKVNPQKFGQSSLSGPGCKKIPD